MALPEKSQPKKTPAAAPRSKSAAAQTSAAINSPKSETVPMQTNNQRAVRILAKSLFRQLKDSGYHNRDVLALSAELVGLITTDLRPGAESSTEAQSASGSASSARIAG